MLPMIYNYIYLVEIYLVQLNLFRLCKIQTIKRMILKQQLTSYTVNQLLFMMTLFRNLLLIISLVTNFRDQALSRPML